MNIPCQFHWDCPGRSWNTVIMIFVQTNQPTDTKIDEQMWRADSPKTESVKWWRPSHYRRTCAKSDLCTPRQSDKATQQTGSRLIQIPRETSRLVWSLIKSTPCTHRVGYLLYTVYSLYTQNLHYTTSHVSQPSIEYKLSCMLAMTATMIQILGNKRKKWKGRVFI